MLPVVVAASTTAALRCEPEELDSWPAFTKALWQVHIRDAGAGGEENERDDDDGNDDGGERRSETRERAVAGVADGEREERAIVARGVRAARRERGTDESHSPVGGVDERRTDAMRR